jgi:hypothetical protein
MPSKETPMENPIRRLGSRLEEVLAGEAAPESSLTLLHAAAAQLLVATGAGAVLEHLTPNGRPQPEHLPTSLVWAPALIGSLAATARFEHNRHPSDRTAAAIAILDASTVAAGAALFLADLLAGPDRPPRRLAPLAFASAGIVGLCLLRLEREILDTERRLRLRAGVLDRLLPRRRPRLDHVVIHV